MSIQAKLLQVLGVESPSRVSIAKFLLKEWGWFPGQHKRRDKLIAKLEALIPHIPKEYRTVDGTHIYRVLQLPFDKVRGTIHLSGKFSGWTTNQKFAEWFAFAGFPGAERDKAIVIVRKTLRQKNVVAYLPNALSDVKLGDRRKMEIAGEKEVILRNDSYYNRIDARAEIVRFWVGPAMSSNSVTSLKAYETRLKRRGL